MTTRVLLVDDHRLIGQGLASLIGTHSDLECVGQADSGREAINLLKTTEVDVVVMDVTMPGLNGIEATRLIRKDHPHVQVLALSMHNDLRFVSRMLKAGATGYLLKDCAFEELAQAIRTITSGRRFLGQDIDASLLRQTSRDPEQRGSLIGRLTAREREIMQLIAEGESSKSIGLMLGISSKTVDTHRKHIMDRLEVESVAELTRIAVREGMIPA